MTARIDPALRARAAQLGVEASYADDTGRAVEVSAPTLRAVCEAVARGGPPARRAAAGPGRRRLPEPPRTWGWQVQLYQLRSETSWGMGDLADLATVAAWAGGQGADVLLCNPLHAPAPCRPVEPSPYFPTSRRFVNPLYLACGEPAPAATALNTTDRIDRDAVWALKRQALESRWPRHDPDQLTEYRRRQGSSLEQFALWCALAERHGRDWRTWPESLRRPDGAGLDAAREELADRVAFHAWLQLLCAQQLAAAQQAARAAGMSVGIVHDLAVGADPGGEDAWALQDVLATDMTVGAPPDTFNQQGQDWRLPPWQPGALAAADYGPYRQLVRSALQAAGGLRIDHVLGLFRLWWIPSGNAPRDGAYVRYDHEALLEVLVDEATMAAALVVGEDLGTVPPGVDATLRERGVLGTLVLWFERAGTSFRPPEKWRRLVVGTVTTHDLPTAAGYLRGEHVRVRTSLGLLADPAAERAEWERERAELLRLLVERGLDRDPVVGLHRLLADSPVVVALGSLADGVGDLRQPNLPGTIDEYPNWRLPVTDGRGLLFGFADLLTAPGTAAIAAALRSR